MTGALRALRHVVRRCFVGDYPYPVPERGKISGIFGSQARLLLAGTSRPVDVGPRFGGVGRESRAHAETGRATEPRAPRSRWRPAKVVSIRAIDHVHVVIPVDILPDLISVVKAT